ncbi:MAG: adenylate cyclase, partial [Verrucomicrobiota bacterium]|nr:adenylate cyclase [Verrucomicrobiota bacterium]
YSIPFEEAEYMLDHFCQQAQISKTRHYVTRGDLTWEVDVFEGANQGLILAEVELKEPNQKIHLPEWVLEEVSGDRRYFNALLALHPYREWSHTDPA